MSRESGGAMRSAEEWADELAEEADAVEVLDDADCKEHALVFIRAIQQDARRATWAEAIEAVKAAIWRLRDDADYQRPPTLDDCLRAISALTPPEGGGGKETKT